MRRTPSARGVTRERALALQARKRPEHWARTRTGPDHSRRPHTPQPTPHPLRCSPRPFHLHAIVTISITLSLLPWGDPDCRLAQQREWTG